MHEFPKEPVQVGSVVLRGQKGSIQLYTFEGYGID